MAQPEPIALKGAPGSPYTRKMLSVLRYRRIAYRLLLGRDSGADLPKPKVELLPTFYLPNAEGQIEAVVDSTPLIRRLEPMVAGREVVPADPVLNFLDQLIEDYADEWLTKAMFHYRWHFEADIEQAGQVLPLWRHISMDPEVHAAMAAMISERQINRLHVVGSNQTTWDLIEGSYRRFVQIFHDCLVRHPFLLGNRPAASDFGVFGQLTQLCHFDPTPTAETLAISKRVYAWVDVVEDLSGLEPVDRDWISRDEAVSHLGPLFQEMGRTYAPVMMANAKALVEGMTEVRAEVEGKGWVQQPFPYQAKCVQGMRQSFAALSLADQADVRRIIADPGMLTMLEA